MPFVGISKNVPNPVQETGRFLFLVGFLFLKGHYDTALTLFLEILTRRLTLVLLRQQYA